MRFPASMIAIAVFIPCFVTASTGLADHHAEDSKVEKKLVGVWEIEDGVNQGETLSEDELEGTTMVVKGDTIITYDREKKEKYRAVFTIDSSKKPIHINMVTYMRSMPPMKSVGILQFQEDDDEFKLCYALPGADRPTKFESPEDSKLMLFECERED